MSSFNGGRQWIQQNEREDVFTLFLLFVSRICSYIKCYVNRGGRVGYGSAKKQLDFDMDLDPGADP